MHWVALNAVNLILISVLDVLITDFYQQMTNAVHVLMDAHNVLMLQLAHHVKRDILWSVIAVFFQVHNVEVTVNNVILADSVLHVTLDML